MMDFMGLDPDAKVKNLSKGNRGRVKLVVTLSRNAPYILMDEPLSGLDPIVRDSIIKGLISFVDLAKQTVIITTHEVNEVEPLLDQVVALRDGEIIKFADVEELRPRKTQPGGMDDPGLCRACLQIKEDGTWKRNADPGDSASDQSDR